MSTNMGFGFGFDTDDDMGFGFEVGAQGFDAAAGFDAADVSAAGFGFDAMPADNSGGLGFGFDVDG